jgi:hypothetical protein
MWAANKGWAGIAWPSPPTDGASWTTNRKDYNGAPHYENKRSNGEKAHQRKTRHNTPGAIPAITRDIPAVISPNNGTPGTRQKSTRVSTQTTDPRINFTPGPIIIPPYPVLRIQASARLVSQQALNAMTMRKAINAPAVFTPRHFVCKAYEGHIPNYAHFASPMVHPTTGETITSYKWLMNDPETAEIWQTAFGKDFGGMTQGDNKTEHAGTNSVLIMTHSEINIAMKAGHKWTYARVVVNYRPQKEDPNRIQIAVRGKLITYKGDTSTRTADLTTSKLLQNSVLSTKGARYMCLDLENFYLKAALDHYEYIWTLTQGMALYFWK